MQRQRPHLRTVVAICALGAVAATAALLLLHRGESTAATSSAARPSAAAIAAIQQQYGVRFTMIGLTASGGMLDLRFVAVDASKVEQLGHHGTKIRLVVEHTGHTLNSEQMTPHFGKIHVGSQYFALLRNDGNALRQGDLVTILVGNLALQHLRVL
ncbi:MAG TPA: hypothetical protein VFD90_09300 [Gaiellales bacterium]|nr:hypothetical protein [Gaiellales bacterium]